VEFWKKEKWDIKENKRDMRRQQMRTAKVDRKTKETDIKVTLNLDGEGKYIIDTSIPFLDHMLSLMCRHGLFDMKIKAKGDIDVDYHHTVEDIGIVFGKTVKQALANMKGISRYGQASVPMDEAIASVSLDISGRPYLVYKVEFPKRSKIKNFDPDLIEDFLQAFVSNSGITLHVESPYGRNTHHIIEAIFKALGRALRHAVLIDPRVKGVPSTKKCLG
jgi:imidazoleglycerol-phosphate dehydratase